MYPLHCLHTFGLSATAKNIIIVDDNELANVNMQAPFVILGQGSNCVFTEDYIGTIVKIELLGKQITQHSDYVEISVKAGENWHQLVVHCMQQGINGLENLALIPGTVGAAPIQNIGAYGVELQQFVDRIGFVDLTTGGSHWLSNAECQFGYRDSIFKRELSQRVLITDVVLHLPKQWQPCQHYGELRLLETPSAQDIFNKVVAVRNAKLPDPAKVGNAGSFFKNPVISQSLFEELQFKWPKMPHYAVDNRTVKIPAAWLIDTLGFKGEKRGGIQCHPTQPLVLTNDGTGTGQQLLGLAKEIQQKVIDVFSISLENEVRLIGKEGFISL
ncbi:UDP-N-acetylmuramate dehydrogenase [Aliiglaciecola litoralis]|uniref:UDP-N-acetylmuramate dehydrogenase n=1 Tax=Aliiglaciecola litoralis TaxID=582857 RepID=UPI0031E43A50